jgi:DHA1 family bicyclomycin/chloramphenicol resistance-like MFS transporter
LAIAYAIMIFSAGTNLAFHALHRPVLPWTILPLSLYSCGMGLAFPSMTILALDLFPSQRGLASSCQSFIQTSGAALNAVIAPLVWGSVLTLNATAAVAVAISVGALFVFLRSASHPYMEPKIAHP